MPHDLGLGGERSQLGSLYLLPLAFKGRVLGGVHVMLRFAPGLDIPLSYWSDMRGEHVPLKCYGTWCSWLEAC